MRNQNKKGLSPAIATALLISLALILSALIFIWASSFLKEKTQKFEEPIERACENINFDAEAYNGELHVVNRGNVPIQAFDLKKKTESSIIETGTVQSSSGGSIGNGESAVMNLPSSVEIGEEIVVSPIIYGVQNGEKTPYVCADSVSLTIKVE